MHHIRIQIHVPFRQLLLALLISPVLAIAQSQSFSGTSFKESLANGKAQLVIIYNDVEDFAVTADNGVVDGFLVQLMEDFSLYLSREYQINSNFKFERIPNNSFSMFMESMRLADGGVFGLSNVSITDERKSKFSFSDPFLENVSVLISNKSIATLQTLEEMNTLFRGKTAYTVEKSTYYNRLRDLDKYSDSSIRITYVESGHDVLEKIADDSNAFGVADLLYYLNFYKRGYAIKRHPVGDLRDDQFGILLPKGTDWQPVLNDFLSEYIPSTGYRKNITHFLGKSATRLIPEIPQSN